MTNQYATNEEILKIKTELNEYLLNVIKEGSLPDKFKLEYEAILRGDSLSQSIIMEEAQRVAEEFTN